MHSEETTVPDGLTCQDVDRDDWVARYVAGRLGPAEASTFEDHYVTCARCQAEVRAAAAVRAVVPELAAHDARQLWSAPRTRWAMGLGVAAAVVALLVWQAPGTGDALTSFGEVLVPPTYLGVEVRAAVGDADSLFVAAMDLYAQGRYHAAVQGLDRALVAGADSAPAEFFRASALLMTGRDAEAAEAFRRVIALGPTPYEPEAHFFLAKTLLRRGEGMAALQELRMLTDASGTLGQHAAALADSVEQRLRR